MIVNQVVVPAVKPKYDAVALPPSACILYTGLVTVILFTTPVAKAAVAVAVTVG